MKQSEVMSEYGKAVELIKMMVSIFDEMEHFETHKLIIRTNGQDKETVTINEMGDLLRLHQVLHRIMIETYGQARIDGFVKPLEKGVSIVNLTI